MLSSWIIHESPTQGRESGSMQYYSLPGVSLDGSVLHGSKPEHLAFNCTSTYVTSTHTLRALLHAPVYYVVLSLSLSRVCNTLHCFAYTNKQTMRCEVLSLSLSFTHRKFSVVDNMGFLNLYELVCGLVGTFWKEGINPPSVDII